MPGHWEGDLIVGKGGRSAIGTLVERSSRYVVLLHLPRGRTADHVRRALTHQLSRLPTELRRTLTWDQGKEMAEHAQFTIDTQIAVYFCDPHSPWQRGTALLHERPSAGGAVWPALLVSAGVTLQGCSRRFIPRIRGVGARIRYDVSRQQTRLKE